MQKPVTDMMEHMSRTNQQLARILDSERHVVVRLSEVVKALPDHNPDFGGAPGILESTQALTQSIVAYLNSLANLEETIAAQLTFVVRELNEGDESE
ncbi:nucleoside-diphosphate sugar epimerase [Paenibacillus arenilitoris]|uniref:Nucleoside-diphosphate sugar epimerase n=1 Tax=Paenibacillus arenilitoris TaxID=2772299 RepID=A0A927H7E0_9BACL|nr:nucleoside-diphosphate sugar epimerase [Paenibacillus arenilitoris]MBD2871516.1 nucleoside-diphosphate sugar epimerase [Paenibacillus arenilitoris]